MARDGGYGGAGKVCAPKSVRDSNRERQQQLTTAENSRPQRRAGFGPWTTLLILCTWPILAVGSLTAMVGHHAIQQQAQVANLKDQGETDRLKTQRLYLALLLLGTGGTALLAGVLAALWARHNPSRFSTPATLAVPETPDDLPGLMEQTVPIINKLYRAGNREETLDTAVTEVRQLLGVDRVVIYSLDENQEGLFIAESVIKGWPKALGATIKDPCFEARYTESYQDGRVRAIDDVYEASLTPCHLEQLEAFEVKANLVAPMLKDGELKGLLIAHQCSAPRAWHLSEVQWFAQIAIAIGLALDNAQFRGELQQAHQTIETLSEPPQAEQPLLTDSNLAASTPRSAKQQPADAAPSLQTLRPTKLTAMAAQAQQQHQEMEQAVQQLTRSVGPILEGLKSLDPSNIEESEAALRRLHQPAEKLLQRLEYSNKLVTQLQRLAIKSPVRAANSKSTDPFAESIQNLAEQLAENVTELRSSAAQIQVVTHHVTGRLYRVGTLPVDPQQQQVTAHQLRQLRTTCTQMGQLLQQLAVTEQASTSPTASQPITDLAGTMNSKTEQTDTVIDTPPTSEAE